jgi:hypothetical protein
MGLEIPKPLVRETVSSFQFPNLVFFIKDSTTSRRDLRVVFVSAGNFCASKRTNCSPLFSVHELLIMTDGATVAVGGYYTHYTSEWPRRETPLNCVLTHIPMHL